MWYKIYSVSLGIFVSSASLNILKYLFALIISSSPSAFIYSMASPHMSFNSLHFLGIVFLILSKQPDTNCSYKI
jgi:hypothetical protein